MLKNIQVNISFKIINEEKKQIDFFSSLDITDEAKKKEKSKYNDYTLCKTIKELIEKFPIFTSYISRRVNETEFDGIFSNNFKVLKNKIKKYIPFYFNIKKERFRNNK